MLDRSWRLHLTVLVTKRLQNARRLMASRDYIFLTPVHIKTDSWTLQLVRVADLRRAITLRQCGALKVAVQS